MVTPYGRGSVCVSCALARLNAPEPGPEGTPSGSGRSTPLTPTTCGSYLLPPWPPPPELCEPPPELREPPLKLREPPP
jgi:hypothetical protein